jgi:hypothetical protein
MGNYLENVETEPTTNETGQIQQVYQQPQIQYQQMAYNQPRIKYKKDIMTGRIIAEPEIPIESWQRPKRFRSVIV